MLNPCANDLRLLFVGSEDHDDVSRFSRLFRRHDLQTRLFRLFPGLAALVQTDDDFDAAFLQVERMGMPLAAVADDGDRLVFQNLNVAIGLIVYFCHTVFPPKQIISESKFVTIIVRSKNSVKRMRNFI